MINMALRDKPDDAVMVWRSSVGMEEFMKSGRSADGLECEEQSKHETGSEGLSPLELPPKPCLSTSQARSLDQKRRAHARGENARDLQNIGLSARRTS
jgi:hypothetical protein